MVTKAFQSGVYTMHAPYKLSRGVKIALVIGVIVYLGINLAILSVRDNPLPVLLWVPPTHAFVLGALAVVVAAMLYAQAAATRLRGYVWFANTIFFGGLVWLVTPFTWIEIFTSSEPDIGSNQVGSYLAWIWTLSLLVGTTGAAWLLRRPYDPRARIKDSVVWQPVAVICVTAVVTVVIIALAPHLPTMIQPDGQVTELNIRLGTVWLICAAAEAIFLIALALRTKMVIHYWIAGIFVIVFGHGIVGATVDRWTLGWYYNRTMMLVSMSLLLLLFVWNALAVQRAASAAAIRDPPTGTLNRRGLVEAIDTALLRGQVCTVLWVYLDGLPSFVTANGHRLGDQLLRLTAERLRRAAPDAALGRIVDESFLVVLTDEPGQDGQEHRNRCGEQADRLLDATESRVSLDSVKVTLSTRIGVDSNRDKPRTTEDLLQNAELAMREEVQFRSLGYRWYGPTSSRSRLRTAQQRQEIEDAIRDRRFELHYQVIHSDIRTPVGCEALIRRIDGSTRIPAGQFIGTAEQTGQILDIGRITVDHLAADAPKLLGALPQGSFITFNLSVSELTDPEIQQKLTSQPLLASSDALVVEVTESEQLTGSEEALNSLRRLRELGYRLAIDDFGTGYSNFSLLQRLKPEIVKIDRSIIVAAARSEGGLAFLAGVVEIARGVDCAVLAEGIEDAAEEVAGCSLPIQYLQGFRYGRPVSPEAFIKAQHPAALPVQQS